MGVVMGPVLRLRGHDHGNNIWRVSAFVCMSATDPAPTLSVTMGSWRPSPTPVALSTIPDYKTYRFDLDIPLQDKAQRLDYRLSAASETWSVQIPGKKEQPLFAYASCNGFSSLKLMKSVADANVMWKHMAEKHLKVGYNVLLLGGDQVYSDAMWELIPALREWNELSWEAPEKVVVPAGLGQALQRHFFVDMYCKRWSQPDVRKMLAQVPTIMMWDDHDIMDGWGSYKKKWADNSVYKLIFETARECFELFQLQGTKTDPVFIPGVEAGYSQFYQFSGISLLVPDLRSERRLDRVLSPTSWDAIYKRLDDVPARTGAPDDPSRHLLVMSSIPVMHARFSQIETLLGWLPGQQELEDDLHDHWSSRPHKGERVRLIRRLLAFSQAKRIRVTVLSGDVHVAAHATIMSDREGNAGSEDTLVQLTSSGIVHPAPPAIMRFALNTLFDEEEEIDRGVTGRMEKMPGDERRYIAARNWLSLERDDPEKSKGRLWANWFVDELTEQPFTRVIQPLCKRP